MSSSIHAASGRHALRHSQSSPSLTTPPPLRAPTPGPAGNEPDMSMAMVVWKPRPTPIALAPLPPVPPGPPSRAVQALILASTTPRAQASVDITPVLDHIEDKLRTDMSRAFALAQPYAGLLQQQAETLVHTGAIDEATYQTVMERLRALQGRLLAALATEDVSLRELAGSPKEATAAMRNLRELSASMLEDLRFVESRVGYPTLAVALERQLGPHWRTRLDERTVAMLDGLAPMFVPSGVQGQEAAPSQKREVSEIPVDATVPGVRFRFSSVSAPVSATASSPAPKNDDPHKEISPKDISPTDLSQFDAVCGAELCLTVPDVPATTSGATHTVVLHGFFREDSLNTTRVGPLLRKRAQAARRAIAEVAAPIAFRNAYIDQLTTRELLTLAPAAITTQTREAFAELKDLKGKNERVLVARFGNADLSAKRRMLTLLLLDPETAPKAGVLYEKMESVSVPEAERLLACIHPAAAVALLQARRDVDEKVSKLAGLSLDDISFEERIALSGMDEDTAAEARRRISGTQESGADGQKAKERMEGLLGLPWGKLASLPVTAEDGVTKTSQFLDGAEAQLNDRVIGHDEAKKVLMQVLGQFVSNGNADGAIIALQGPPGNGKTTFAQAVADILGRKMGLLPMGGQTDAELIYGHGYTYVGSRPGRIVEILKQTGMMNPVIVIDELDKVSETPRGQELFGVLTNLLDPSQNSKFLDKYLGMTVDASKIVWIITYNDESRINNPALLDRMIRIKTGPLSRAQKMQVGQKDLQKMLTDVKLKRGDIQFTEEALGEIIDKYTFEAGARRMKEFMNKVVRQLNLRRLRDAKATLPISVGLSLVHDILGEPKVEVERVPERPQVGWVNGLYATTLGIGGVLPVQVTRLRRGGGANASAQGELMLTGSLGETMQESMKVAHTLVLNCLPDEIYKKITADGGISLHIHCPDGATPKDGPSAGAAIVTACISELSGVAVRNDVAMTGEIDLKGNVKPIGGLDSKLIGAKKAGAKLVLVPKGNEKDLEKIKHDHPTLIDDAFRVVLVERIGEVLGQALVTNSLNLSAI